MTTNLSLQQLFGASAYQDSDRLVINKGDLFNLSTRSTNTAESLLVALVMNACKQFEGLIEDENSHPITNENNQAITYNNKDRYELLNVFYWKRQYIAFQSLPYALDTFVIESNEIQ
ncbi:hypothetical protein [Aliterella atlantica]|uniref:Uncharacterized protein n=1 Tax=Aliterella atlantica CENA595 TaxID=1618023 RepID=A0A0D8ZSC3_9CYAN|nr:hypothetical protein [Aliterella atlantica]KJH71232.1 hypothetical protein UH38_13135 [Aliterella atlantica CENA595]